MRCALLDDSFSCPSHSTMASNASNNLDLLGPYLTDEQSFQATLTAKEAEGISRLILNIVFDYALNKFDDSKDRLTVDTDKFLSMINHFVTAGRQVEACLSSFPFKSANKVYKVLGTLPDKAEELALERLNYMCIRIQDVYRPGAKVTIVSDGAPYNGKRCAKLAVIHAEMYQTYYLYRIAIPGLIRRLCAKWLFRKALIILSLLE